MDTFEWHDFCEDILSTYTSNEEIDIIRKNFLMLNNKFGLTFKPRALNDDYAVFPFFREIQGRPPLSKEALVIYLLYASRIIYKNPTQEQSLELIEHIGQELEGITTLQWHESTMKIVAQLNKSAGFN